MLIDLEVLEIPVEITNEASSKHESSKRKTVFSIHNVYDENGNVVKRLSTPMTEWESLGTIKLFEGVI